MGIRCKVAHSLLRNYLEKLVEYLVDTNFPARLQYFFFIHDFIE